MLIVNCGAIDLQWKVIYVGSAESEEYDQVLDDILVGPISVGTKKFVFQVRIIVYIYVFVLFVNLCVCVLISLEMILSFHSINC